MDDTRARVPDVLEIRSEADPAELSTVRRRIRDYLQNVGTATEIVEDIELVVSELATNVIEHTTSTSLTILVGRVDDDWFVDVADVDDLSILDDVALPNVTEPAGRGLFVVSSIVDDIRIVHDAGNYAIRCRIAG
jgi:serine/threonine-protein kinase RsbW